AQRDGTVTAEAGIVPFRSGSYRRPMKWCNIPTGCPRSSATDLAASLSDHRRVMIDDHRATGASTRQEEWRSFLFFTVVMAPVIAVAVVGGYGFLVWMYQLIAGPPGA